MGASVVNLPGSRSRLVDPSRTLAMTQLAAHAMVACCTLFQLLMFWDVPENAAACLLVCAYSVPTIHYTLGGRRFLATPLSMLLLLGFNFVTSSGALLLTSLAAMPLTGNLLAPDRTFGMLAASQGILIVSHVLYRSLAPATAARDWLRRTILTPLAGFRQPDPAQLWLMGLIGCAAVLATRIGLYADGPRFGGDEAFVKLLSAFTFLAAAPFSARCCQASSASTGHRNAGRRR